MSATGIPAKGELYEFTLTRGGEGHAKDWNNCGCRHYGFLEVKFDEPHWVETKVVEEVATVTYWADNSIDIVSVTGNRATPVAPHGDACF